MLKRFKPPTAACLTINNNSSINIMLNTFLNIFIKINARIDISVPCSGICKFDKSLINKCWELIIVNLHLILNLVSKINFNSKRFKKLAVASSESKTL